METTENPPGTNRFAAITTKLGELLRRGSRPADQPPVVDRAVVDKPITDDSEPKRGQLVQILDMLGRSEEILDFVAGKILQNDSGRFNTAEEVKQYLRDNAEQRPLALSKLIELKIGKGTMRTLSFMGADPRAPKDVLKILEGSFEKESFEKRAEKGMYMGIMESYDVKWSPEKVARDIWQNFFDANGQTLDGIESKVIAQNGTATIRIDGPQTYDWRQLVHIGATSKEDIERAAGGFGEGTKILALVLLRDHGIREIKFSSGDWQIEYYLTDVPQESYTKKIKGLYVKKSKRKFAAGNTLEIIADKPTAEKELANIQETRALFYSSDNPDFQDPNFDDHDSGGFKILPPLHSIPFSDPHPKGHFYLAGQRVNYQSRDSWKTVEGVNIWTWKKIIPLDRDRGLVAPDQMRQEIIPFIVAAMKRDNLTQAVYDFKPYWSEGQNRDVAILLQAKIVEALERQNVRLKFESQYLSSDVFNFTGNAWIVDELEQQGYTLCHDFLGKIGMKKATECFKELQEQFHLEATPAETHKIELLKQMSREIGYRTDDIKDVWLQSGNEEHIFHGQCNNMFYWMSRESLGGDFETALQTYLHEMAHRRGPDGSNQFNDELKRALEWRDQFKTEYQDLYRMWTDQWNDIK